ncbi:MAG: type I-E CRISPR-associated protein Cse2/CasB [Chloroflexota bacterium]|nr:type I-E CRISPR-associated protein Cse2/CasB [Chloroflexota bacterium]
MDETAEKFVERLTRCGPGEKAALRRLARGHPTGLAVAYRLMPGTVPRWAEEDYLTVALLYGSHPHHDPDVGDLGSVCRQAKLRDQRFEILLAAEPEQLRERLRTVVGMVGSLSVNYVQLLKDIRQWDHPDRFVQRRWARSFWTEQETVSDE